MPAIAPRDKPLRPDPSRAAAAGEPVGELPSVEEGKSGGIEDVMGNSTSTQRLVALEPTQHESVAFGELAAQKLHKPCRLVEKPQSLGSFSAPVTHLALSESLGKAQVVKSARIWSMKFWLG